MKKLLAFLSIITLSACDPLIFSIPTPSMEPTLPVGSKIVADFSELKRNSVVIFDPPIESETFYVARMVAMPGDTLEMVDGNVIVNGKNHP